MKKDLVFISVICILTIVCAGLGYGWYKTAKKLELTRTLLECSVALHEVDNNIAQLTATIESSEE